MLESVRNRSLAPSGTVSSQKAQGADPAEGEFFGGDHFGLRKFSDHKVQSAGMGVVYVQFALYC